MPIENTRPEADSEMDMAASDLDTVQVHRRLTLNSLSNLIRYAVAVVIAFFLTPFTVNTLGEASYGFWILILSVVGYANILELGIQPAVVKLVSQMKAAAEKGLLNELVTAAFLFFIAAGIAGASAFSLVLPSFFNKMPEGLPEINYGAALVALIGFDIVLLFLNQLCTGILYGWQAYVAKNFVDVTASMVNAVLIVIFLPTYGLFALAATKTSVDLFILCSTAILIRRKIPQIKLSFRDVGRKSFSQLLGFGSRVFISATATRMGNYAQPLIITTFKSPAATTFYAIPSALVDYIRQIIWALATGFMPTFSELHSRNERTLLQTVYIAYSRYILLLVLPVILLMFVYGVPFLSLWIGPVIAQEGGAVLSFLGLTVLVESFQPLIWRLFIGVAKLNFLIAVSAASSILIILFSLLIVQSYGIIGVAVSVLVVTLISQSLFTPYVCKFFCMTIPSLLRQVHVPALVVAIPTYGLGLVVSRLIGADSYARLISGAIIIILFYAVLVYTVALNRKEKDWILQKTAARRGRITR